MNNVGLIGRLTRDPETRYTQDQKPICSYSLAVDRIGEGTDFINITVFGKGAEFAQKYFKKGLRVALTGRIRVDSYKDKQGNNRQSFGVVADRQYFADGKAQTEGFVPTEEPLPDSFEEGLPF